MYNRIIITNLILIISWIVLLWDGALPGYIEPGITESNISFDAYFSYAENIDSGIVTDWHSVFHIYEGILLKKIASFLGFSLTGLDCINIMAFLAIVLMIVSISYLSTIGSKTSRYYIIFPLAILSISKLNGIFAIWRIDNFFCIFLFAMIASVISLYRCQNKKIKILLICSIIILLWHCCGYRRNAILLTPIIITAVLYSSEKVRKLNIFKKMITIFIFCGVAFTLFIPIQNLIMPAVKSYPESAMMISDIRIAHVLRNTQDSFFSNNSDIRRYPTKDNIIGAHWHVLHNREHCSFCKVYSAKFSSWPHMYHSFSPYDLYIESWKSMPKDMFMAKIIQIAQFYRLDIFPFIKSYIMKKYPNTKGKWPSTPNIIEVIKIWGTYISLLIISFISLKKIIKRNNHDITIEHLYVLVSCIAFVYYASFIIVTPTPDFRYIAPSLTLGQIMLFVFIEEGIRNLIKKKSSYKQYNGACF